MNNGIINRCKKLKLKLYNDVPNVLEKRKKNIRHRFYISHPISDIPALFGCTGQALKYWDSRPQVPFWITNQLDNLEKQVKLNSKFIDNLREDVAEYYITDVPIFFVYNYIKLDESLFPGSSLPYAHCIFRTIDPFISIDMSELPLYVERMRAGKLSRLRDL